MYFYYSVTPDQEQALRALEEELQVPMRLVGASTGTRRNTWAVGQCSGHDVDAATEIGVSIAVSGGPTGYTDYRYEADIGTDYRIPELGVIPAAILADYEALETHDEVIGCLDREQRIVYLFFAWNNAEYSNDEINNLVYDAVRDLAGAGALDDEARAARERERLAEYCHRTFNQKIVQHRNNISTHERLLSESQHTITTSTMVLIEEQKMLRALTLIQEDDAAEQLLREWDRLADHSRCASRRIAGNTLIITTTDDLRLTRDDTDESRWLGAFEVRISLRTFDIKLRNLNTMRGGRHHPHVPGDGEPCFGSHANGFYQLLGQGEIYTCFELLIQYIESVNLRDDWGAYASYWFEVADERPVGWTADEINELVTA